MEDVGRSYSEEEQAMHVYYNFHRPTSEDSRLKNRFTSSHFEIPIESLHDEPTSSQVEK